MRVCKLAVPVLTLLLTACGGSGIENLQKGNPASRLHWGEPGERISVSFDWHDGHLIIPVRVNGAELRMAFDTGAAATVIFETGRTRSLKLEVERQLGLASGVQADIANDVSLSVAGIRLEGLTVLHVPLRQSPIFTSEDEAYFDGAIGYDLLRRFVTQIDYVSRTITFFKGPVALDTGEGWQPLALDVAAHVPYVQWQLKDGAERQFGASLLADTGAPSYLYLNPELVPGLQLPERRYRTSGRGFNGPYARSTGRLQAASLGAVGFRDVVTHFDTGDFRELGRGIGLAGNGLLKNFDLVFDYAAGRLLLRPNGAFDGRSHADRSGLDLEPHRRGAVVRSVAAGSAAEGIGIRQGDVVTAIAGVSIDSRSFDTAVRALESDRSEVEVCWTAASGDACRPLALFDRL